MGPSPRRKHAGKTGKCWERALVNLFVFGCFLMVLSDFGKWREDREAQALKAAAATENCDACCRCSPAQAWVRRCRGLGARSCSGTQLGAWSRAAAEAAHGECVGCRRPSAEVPRHAESSQ